MRASSSAAARFDEAVAAIPAEGTMLAPPAPHRAQKKISLPNARLRKLARQWRADAARMLDIGLTAQAELWESAATDAIAIIRERREVKRNYPPHIHDPEHLQKMRERLRIKRSGGSVEQKADGKDNE